MPDTVGNNLTNALGISLTPVLKTVNPANESVEFNDVDYYRFTLSSRSSVNLTLSNLSADANVDLRNSAGAIVTDINGIAQASTNKGTLVESINALLDPGTYFIRVSPGDPADPLNPSTTTPSTTYSLNIQGDNFLRSDIVWRNYASGVNGIWTMNGTTLSSATTFLNQPNLNWQIVGAGDVNNDGSADIFWRNYESGGNGYWLMNGNTFSAAVPIPNAPLPWRIQGVADFNRDGRPDLLLRNPSTRDVGIWFMNGPNILSTTLLTNVAFPDSSWNVQGVGDFNNDGSPDLVWRNSINGQNGIWLMNGARFTGAGILETIADQNRQIQGTGDFNGDGQTDILWRNFATGANEVWLMNGTIRSSIVATTPVADPNWRAVAPLPRSETPRVKDTIGNTTATPLNIGPLNGNGVYRDTVGGADTGDYYLFNLGSPTNFNLSLTGPNGGTLTGDLDVELFDSTGAFSRQSAQSGSTSETINVSTLDPGTYYIRVFPKGSSDSSAYNLNLSVNNLPVLATNQPLTVAEATQATISSTLLQVTDENDPANRVVFTLVAPPDPTKGSLSLNSAALTTGNTFTQADINSNRLTYRQNGSETLTDSFVFSVSDGTPTGTISNTTFSINVTPANDPPVLLSNTGITVTEGAAAAFTSLSLLVTDSEQPAAQLIYGITSLPTTGSLLLNGNALTVGSTFTQADIDNGTRLSFRHNGTETPASDSFTFAVTDGAGGTISPLTNTLSISILAFNDAPVLTSNLGITVSEDESKQLTNAILNATDAEFQSAAERDRITYTIVSAPLRGSINLNATTGVTSFTQADLDNGRVFYDHDGSKTNSDTFVFNITDGPNVIGPFTFNVAVTSTNFVPVLATNTILSLDEAATAAITPAVLQVTDQDNAPPELIYTLTSAPTAGTLNRLGTPLSVGQTFTQADIDTGTRISYQHSGSETTSDSFVFSVFDRVGSGLASRTFSIAVAPVDDPPALLSNTRLTLAEGATSNITTTLLSATDPDSLESDLVYTIVTAPTNGTLIRNGQTAVTTFTQADLNSNLLQYQQSGTESTSDSFVFQLSSGGVTTPDQTFNIAVVPVNDPPGVSLNTGLTVSEGSISTIGDTTLLVTDADGPGPLTYVLINGPTNGQLRLGATTLSGGTTFTQADITNSRLTYAHNGNESPASDSFTFSAVDGAGGTLPVTPFTIGITPVNDPPLLTAPTTPLTLNEDSSLSFSNTNRITVTDAENDDLTITFTATNGRLTIGSGAPDVTLTRTGKASAINTAISSLVYRPDPNYNGPAQVTISLNDGTNTVNQTIDLTVNPINDGPTLTVPTATQTTVEDQTLTITGIVATDIDSGNSPVRVTLRATNGGLTLNAAESLEFLEGTSNGANTVAVAGTIADIANALASLNYQGNPNFNGSDTITITLDDQGNIGGAPLAVTRSISVTVASVNDAPSFTVGPDQSVLEDTGTITVPGWATNILKGAANESSQTLTFNVTTSNDALFTTAGRPTINPTTGDLTYTLAPNAFGTATVTVVLRDNGGTANGGVDVSTPQTFTINVTPVNDAPTFTKGANITIAEDAPAQTVNWATGISAGPNETGQSLSFLIDNNNPSLFSVAPSLTSGGVLTFTPTPNANGTAVLVVRLQDDGGTANGGVDTSIPQTLTISVTAVNDAPVLTLPGPQSVAEDTTLTVTGTSITDIDAGSGPLQVTLTALGTGAASSAGNISFGAASGVTITGNNSSAVTLTGTLAALNTALASFNYQSKLNISGSERIVVSVNDRGNTGSGGFLADTKTLSINIDAVNDAPVLTVSGTSTRNIVEDTLTSLSGISVSDVDAGTNPIEVTLNALQGLLSLNTSGLASNTGNGTNTVTISGTVAALNASLGSLRYQGNPNYYGADTVTATVNDLGFSGTGGSLTDTKSLSINVTAVNDPPQLTLPTGPLTLTEDTDFSFTDAAAILATDVDSGESRIQVTLSVNNGILNLNPTDLNLISGGNGTKTATFEGTATAIATALGTLVYRGNANYSGGDTLTVTLNDRGATGSTTPATITRSVSLNVTPVNDLPVLVTNSRLTVSEGQTRTISNSLLRTTDVDNTATQIVYTIVTAPNVANGSLRLNSSTLSSGSTFTQDDINNSRLSYAQNGSETLADSFVFRVSDGGAPLADATFDILVNPINDQPTLVGNQTLSLSEGQTSTITNTLLRVTDTDNVADELRYTLTNSPSSGNLRLNGTNLTSNQTFTQADIDSGRISYRHNGTETTSDSFIFAVTDGAGGSIGTRVFNIAVTPVNDAPQIVSSGPLTLSEGATTTITNTVLRTSDADTPASSVRYTISSAPVFGSLRLGGVSLSGGQSFSQQDIDNGLVTYQHNGSENNSDVFVFQVSDGTAAPTSRIFNITVTPVNDPPSLTSNTGISVAGDVPSVTEINSSQLAVTDVDNTSTQLTYTLLSLPSVGTLRLNGTPLALNGTFTQADVEAGNLTYEYSGSGGSDTSFQFSVSDGGAGGTLPTNFFDISFNYS